MTVVVVVDVVSLVVELVLVVVVVDVDELVAVVVVDVVVLVVVFVVAFEVVAARALPVADNIRATVGGVTAANRPAFSRNRRRPVSDALSFSSFGIEPSTPSIPDETIDIVAVGGWQARR